MRVGKRGRLPNDQELIPTHGEGFRRARGRREVMKRKKKRITGPQNKVCWFSQVTESLKKKKGGREGGFVGGCKECAIVGKKRDLIPVG